MLDVKRYQKMSRDLVDGIEKVKEDLADETVEGVAGGGVLKVTANGNQEILKVEIGEEAVDPDDIQMLEDLFKAAANQALEKSKEMQQDAMSKVTGGAKLPRPRPRPRPCQLPSGGHSRPGA